MSKTDANTKTIDPRELPLVNPPAIPLWAENFAFQVTCPKANAGFFTHLARQSFDTSLWRETLIADLGGDEVYLWRGFGRGAHAAGPGAAQMKFICEESFHRWTLIFDGAAMRVPRNQVLPGYDGASRSNPIVPLRLRLNVVGDGPIWELDSAVSDHDWAKAYYNQSMRLESGEVTVDGKTIALEGVVTRDHSRGPRDFGTLGSYAWIHGGMPGGRHFIVLDLAPRDGSNQPALRHAMIMDGDKITTLEILESAIPETIDGGPMKYVLRLRGPNGIETIEAERMSTVIISLGKPNQLLLGPATDSTTTAHIFESPTRFRWNGEVCYGWSEQAIAVTF